MEIILLTAVVGALAVWLLRDPPNRHQQNCQPKSSFKWSFGPDGVTISGGPERWVQKSVPWVKVIELSGGTPGDSIEIHSYGSGGWIAITWSGPKLTVRRFRSGELESIIATEEHHAE